MILSQYVGLNSIFYLKYKIFKKLKKFGANRESNPRPHAPEARIIPLDHSPSQKIGYLTTLETPFSEFTSNSKETYEKFLLNKSRVIFSVNLS